MNLMRKSNVADTKNSSTINLVNLISKACEFIIWVDCLREDKMWST